MAAVLVFNQRVLHKSQPTKRALDARDSARFSSSFLASIFFLHLKQNPRPRYCPLVETVGHFTDFHASEKIIFFPLFYAQLKKDKKI